MEFDPAAVEILEHELKTHTKYRFMIGYNVSDKLYIMRRFGMLYPNIENQVQPIEANLDSFRKTYNEIAVPGELTFPVFAYDLGARCEWDSQGLPHGNWPPVGRLRLKYEGKFPMPGGRLPEAYRHLQLMRLVRP